jgi:hypothetical protein
VFISVIPWTLMRRKPMLDLGMVMAQGFGAYYVIVLATAAILPSTPHPLPQTDGAPHSRPCAVFATRVKALHRGGNRSDLGDCRNNAQIEARAPMPHFNSGVYWRNSPPQMAQPYAEDRWSMRR